MVGLLVQLLLSWLIVWLAYSKGLSVLGLSPNRQRCIQFVWFFLLTAFFSSSDYLMRWLFAKHTWQLNPAAATGLILQGFWWNVKSVLFEELIFRGALFYLLIVKMGARMAILISAVSFGVYHWFSQEVLGNYGQMLTTFATTGAMGIVYAYGYARTFSLYIPCGIHLGWNLVRSVVFSETAIGDQLLIPVKPLPEVAISHAQYYLWLLLPIVGAVVCNFLLIRRQQQESSP